MRSDLISSLEQHHPAFGVTLDTGQLNRLADFYDVVREHNELLHLVAPCSPEEFAVRHILESLTLLKHASPGTRLADVGPGAGLPSLPCLIVRSDLTALLIESKEKKTKYLDKAAERLGLTGRVETVNRQFEEADPGTAEIITCRALDRFTDKLAKMLKWSRGRKLLLFGGPAIRGGLLRSGCEFGEQLMPMSEQRYLFIVQAGARRSTR